MKKEIELLLKRAEGFADDALNDLEKADVKKAFEVYKELRSLLWE